ncbi:MAG TPA: ABC transporter substrate-binding protein [Usitatibacteraceae bacterium]|nr:ABC transporter substrate-binding protein [Usitatibacteraceae bacterium]
MPQRSVRRMAVWIALLFAFAAAAPLDAKTLRYATQDEPQTLDPHSAQLAVTNRLLSNVYEGLVGRDKNFKLVPWLAVSWTQPDPLTWRFKLRANVKFHDGAVFSADDVVFSFERVSAPTSQLKSSVLGVAAVKKVDDLTVEFKMKEPNPILLNHLFQFRIMNKAWAVKHNATVPQNYRDREDTYAARHANGTGPFRVKERQPDVRTVLTANADWWNRSSPEKGNLSEVTLLPIRSAATRAAALLSGEVDFVNDPPPQDIARLKAGGNVKILESPEERVQYLVFDTFREELLYSSVKGKNPLKDRRVREAVARAIDVQAIRTKVMRGLSKPIGTLVTPTEGGYAKDADTRQPYDPEAARRQLAEAGYPNGFAITLDCGNNQPAADICQSIPPMLSRIGIAVKPNIVPTANYFAKLQKYDTSFYLLSWGTPTSDAHYTLQYLLHTPGAPGNGEGNYGRYSNAEFDALIDQARAEPDLARRDARLREALLIINRELPVVALHQAVIPWAMKPNVSAVFPPNSVPYFFRFRVD